MVGKWVYYLIAFGFALAAVLGWIIYFLQEQNKKMSVAFFDVGQGDAILISAAQNQLLIDGGRHGRQILDKLGRKMPFWDRRLEVIIATHPDQDHIGGLIDVFKNYEVATFIGTKAENDSQTFRIFSEKVEAENDLQKLEASKGLKIKFPAGQELEIIYPFGLVSSEKKENNDLSVVSKLTAGSSRFLFTGDISQKTENLFDEETVRADILKVSHHGSRYSTSADFLARVNPKQSVISVGRNNIYGHPAPEVIGRLLEKKVQILRTDQMGDIVFLCQNQKAECQLSFN